MKTQFLLIAILLAASAAQADQKSKAKPSSGIAPTIQVDPSNTASSDPAYGSMDEAYIQRLQQIKNAGGKATAAQLQAIDQEIADVRANPCPMQTLSACQSQLSTIPDSGVNYPKVTTDLKACERHIVPSAHNPAPDCQCLANLYLYSVRQSTVKNPDGTFRDDHSMGFDKSDAAVLANEDKVAAAMTAKGYPGMFEVPAEIRQLYNNPGQKLPDNYRDLLPREWKVIEYSSRSIASPGGNSFRRLLIVIPGKAYDKYVQLTIPNALSPDAKEKLVNYQVIQKMDENTGATLAKPKIHFREIWRNYQSDHTVSFKPHDGQHETCITCHPNGMRELSPSPGSVGHQQLHEMDEINAMMRSYGQIDWGDSIRMPTKDPKKVSSMGPPVGERVGCTRCHNGQPPTSDNPHFRDPLSEDTSTQTLKMKVTEDMTMPIRPRMDHFLELLRKFEDSVTPDEYRQMQAEFVHYNHQDGGQNGELYEKLLKRMLDKHQITQDYFNEMSTDLKNFREDSKEVYQSYVNSLGKDRIAWMKNRTCEKFVVPVSAPAAPTTKPTGKH